VSSALPSRDMDIRICEARGESSEKLNLSGQEDGWIGLELNLLLVDAEYASVYTYIVGVTNWVVWAETGVETEPLFVFHRLARYPGVDEKDLTTFCTENELLSVPEIPESSWLDAGMDGGNEAGVFSSTRSTFVPWTCSSTCSVCDDSNKSSESTTSFF
jgi:hypothetical protein